MASKVQKKKEVNKSEVVKKKVNSISDIVKRVKGVRGINQKFTEGEIKEVLTNLLGVIEDRLEAKESVEFRGYFTLSTRTQAAKQIVIRFGKDKGKPKKIPAKFVPTCKFSSIFKKEIA
jgi:nucleoid DNA-binding protein